MAVMVMHLWFLVQTLVNMFDSKIKQHDNPSVKGQEDKKQQQRLKWVNTITRSFQLVVTKSMSAQNSVMSHTNMLFYEREESCTGNINTSSMDAHLQTCGGHTHTQTSSRW